MAMRSRFALVVGTNKPPAVNAKSIIALFNELFIVSYL
jgi:hypothetical protein